MQLAIKSVARTSFLLVPIIDVGKKDKEEVISQAHDASRKDAEYK